MISTDGWVFVTGCARAGTTVAGRLLDCHKDCFVLNECGYIRDFIVARDSGKPAESHNTRLVGSNWIRYRNVVWDPIRDGSIEEACEMLRAVYSNPVVFADKVPWLMEMWVTIRSIIPSSKFIVVERRRSEIIDSCERCSRDNRNFAQMFARWGVRRIDSGMAIIEEMRNVEGVLHIKHAEMQRDHVSVAEKMLEFVGLSSEGYDFSKASTYFTGPEFLSKSDPISAIRERRIYSGGLVNSYGTH